MTFIPEIVGPAASLRSGGLRLVRIRRGSPPRPWRLRWVTGKCGPLIATQVAISNRRPFREYDERQACIKEKKAWISVLAGRHPDEICNRSAGPHGGGAELVRGASGARELTRRERNAMRQAILRVLETLHEGGQVARIEHARNSLTYVWGEVRREGDCLHA